MEPMTIREYYVDKVERKMERLEKKAQKAEDRLTSTLTITIRNLYAQGMSVETIANLMAQPIDFVQGILDKKS